MAQSSFNALVTDNAGNVQASPTVTVLNWPSLSTASIFDGTGNPLPNPFTGNTDGTFSFFAETGTYQVNAATGSGSRSWTGVFIGNLKPDVPTLSANNTFTGANRVSLQAGSASAPALHRFDDDNTGIYFSALDFISFSTGGVGRAQIRSDGTLSVVKTGTAASPHIVPDGDLDTGTFSPGANLYSLSAGAQEQLRVGLNAPLRARFQSTVGTSYNTMGPGYFIRAWVNFNGTGTVAIRASGNVSSITDLNTGNYRLNFSDAMPDTNYSWLSGAMGTNASYFYAAAGTFTANSVDIVRGVANAIAAGDEADIAGAIIR